MSGTLACVLIEFPFVCFRHSRVLLCFLLLLLLNRNSALMKSTQFLSFLLIFFLFFRQRASYRQHYLPWALSTSKVLKPLMNVYWEKRWTQNIDELRKELNITPIQLDATSPNK